MHGTRIISRKRHSGTAVVGSFTSLTLSQTTSFYRATACNATHGIAVGILSVRLSACPSVGRVYCDKTKWWTADILILHETAITLLLWHQQWSVGDAPFPLKSALKVAHSLRKAPTSTDFRS